MLFFATAFASEANEAEEFALGEPQWELGPSSHPPASCSWCEGVELRIVFGIPAQVRPRQSVPTEGDPSLQGALLHYSSSQEGMALGFSASGGYQILPGLCPGPDGGAEGACWWQRSFLRGHWVPSGEHHWVS